jgi:hypothetical protein
MGDKSWNSESTPPCTDEDNDGWNSTSECNYNNKADCNDGDDTIYPGAIELCDTKDNDCNINTADGVNESLYNVPTTCGLGICASSGKWECQGGNMVDTCANGTAQTEDCDAGYLDEDCDGNENEDCACVNGNTSACYTGAPGTEGVGICHNGTMTCASGQWGDCIGEVYQTDETCNSLDDNCNDLVDDGFDVNMTCTVGLGECKASGLTICNANHDGTICDATAGSPSDEICDGKDNDCNDVIDDNGVCTKQYYCDNDSDARISSAVSGTCYDYGCAVPEGCTLTQGTDCDDQDGSIYPGAPELCDGKHNDCNDLNAPDGSSEEWYQDPTTCGEGAFCSSTGSWVCETGGVKNDTCEIGPKGTLYRDADGDGFGNATNSDEFCDYTNGYVEDSTDCSDNDDTTNPDASDYCTNDYEFMDRDCNYTNNLDCTDFCGDADGDSFVDPATWARWGFLPSIFCPWLTQDGDCDDYVPTTYPGANEECNGVLDDCDGQLDKKLEGGIWVSACPALTFYCDGDNDGYNSTVANGTCDTHECVPAGCTTVPGTDCNDINPAVHPNAPEVCNGIDDNCVYGIDELYDVNDACTVGIGECARTGVKICDAQGTGTECSVTPGSPSPEVCDGKDNNCNSVIDDLDADNDRLNDCTADKCLNSVLDNIILNPNQYAQNTLSSAFEVGTKNEQSIVYNMTSTKGCTCRQIVARLGLGLGQITKGCAPGVMQTWTGIAQNPDRQAGIGQK